MKEWFAGLESRERRMVIAGSLVVAVVLLYAFLVDPAYSAYQRRHVQVAEQRETLAWMQEAAAQVLHSAPAASVGAGLGGRSLLAVVDGSARQAGLGAAMKRVKPDGSHGVRVWFEGVPFDGLVAWLGGLADQYQIDVTLISLERQGESGRVQAQLTLEVAG